MTDHILSPVHGRVQGAIRLVPQTLSVLADNAFVAVADEIDL